VSVSVEQLVRLQLQPTMAAPTCDVVEVLCQVFLMDFEEPVSHLALYKPHQCMYAFVCAAHLPACVCTCFSTRCIASRCICVHPHEKVPYVGFGGFDTVVQRNDL